MSHSTATSIFAIFLLAFLIGCSSSNLNPSVPDQTDDHFSIPITESNETNRTFLGSWNVDFNMDDLSASVKPDRISMQHYNVTTLLPPLGIIVNSYNQTTGIADLDVSISNPNPFGAYDVRLIVYWDHAGHALKNHDNWTSLWTFSEGAPINSFKAYAQSQPNRYFAPQALHTENLRILMPGGNFTVLFAIDASFPSNCEEPYLMENFSHETLSSTTGAEAPMQLDVYDWQDDISGVFLHCPMITDQTIVPFTFDQDNTWTGTLINSTGITEGEYPGAVVAYSSGIGIYDLIVISVTP